MLGPVPHRAVLGVRRCCASVVLCMGIDLGWLTVLNAHAHAVAVTVAGFICFAQHWHSTVQVEGAARNWLCHCPVLCRCPLQLCSLVSPKFLGGLPRVVPLEPQLPANHSVDSSAHHPLVLVTVMRAVSLVVPVQCFPPSHISALSNCNCSCLRPLVRLRLYSNHSICICRRFVVAVTSSQPESWSRLSSAAL